MNTRFKERYDQKIVPAMQAKYGYKNPHEVPRRDLGVDVPRFYPLPSFGADSEGRTFGVWLVLRDDGSADAFYARDPRSGCYLPWRSDLVFEGQTGWFRDPCHGGTYTLDGRVAYDLDARVLYELDNREAYPLLSSS